MKPFDLVRTEDVTGLSGTGRIAEGVVWDDGRVSIRWLTEVRSTVDWDSMGDLLAVHGHGGRTFPHWHDQTVLGKVGRLVAAGLTFTDIHQAGSGPEPWVHITTCGRDEWLTWLRHLSPAEHPEDAAVWVDWEGPRYGWQVRWMDATGNVLVTYLAKDIE